MNSSNLMTESLPGDLNQTVNLFQRLLLVKALREVTHLPCLSLSLSVSLSLSFSLPPSLSLPSSLSLSLSLSSHPYDSPPQDKLQQCIAAFVSKKLGPKFAESPNATMEDIYRDLDNKTPCIFVLSSGADPTGMLLRFAKKFGYGDRLHIVSLGQGQGPYAKQLIDNGTKTGDWVILQNCMLAKSWMPELDKIIFELQERAVKDDGSRPFSPFHTPPIHSFIHSFILRVGRRSS
jgi:hypothetical protein